MATETESRLKRLEGEIHPEGIPQAPCHVFLVGRHTDGEAVEAYRTFRERHDTAYPAPCDAPLSEEQLQALIERRKGTCLKDASEDLILGEDCIRSKGICGVHDLLLACATCPMPEQKRHISLIIDVV
jgi:hypothetical protein